MGRDGRRLRHRADGVAAPRRHRREALEPTAGDGRAGQLAGGRRRVRESEVQTVSILSRATWST